MVTIRKQMKIKIRNMEELGNFLRNFRRRKQLSQETTAQILGVSRKLLSEIETGKKNTVEIGKIFQILQRIGIEIWLAPRERA